MKTNPVNYAALVALDWGDQEHAFALKAEGQKETGVICAAPEPFHAWLGQLGQRHHYQPVALAIEAGRNAVVHALACYPVAHRLSGPSGHQRTVPESLHAFRRQV
jgi:hypothetical protein